MKYICYIVACLFSATSLMAYSQVDSLVKAVNVSEELRTEDAMVLSLNELIKIALSENPSVKIAYYEVQKMKYTKYQAYTEILPKINSSLSYQRVLKKQIMYFDFNPSIFSPGAAKASPKTKTNSNGIEIGRWNSLNAGITATMPLFSPLLLTGIKLSNESVVLALEQARESRQNMVEQVKLSYYTVLLTKELLKVYQSEYENSFNNYKITKKKAEQGLVSELDVLRAKTSYVNVYPQIYKAWNSLFLALGQLKLIVGIAMDKDLDVSGSLEDYKAELLNVENENMPLNLNQNTQLRQLQSQLKQLSLKLKMSKMAYLPTIAANISLNINAMSDDFDLKEYRWTPYNFVGLSVSIPIFSGGKKYYDIKKVHTEQNQLALKKQMVERSLSLELRKHMNTMLTSVASYKAAQEAVYMAEKAFKTASLSYDKGMSTLTDLNDTQLQLSKAQLAQKQAVYDYLVAKANMEKLIGENFEK